MVGEWFSWDAWVHTFNGGIHFAIALTAILLGAITLLRPKGTVPHRALGSAYVICMVITNMSALSMYELSGKFTLFHWFAIISLATVGPGYLAIIVYKFWRSPFWLTLHSQFIGWSYYGLCAAGVWQVAVRFLVPTMGPEHYSTILAALSVLTFAAPLFISPVFLRRRASA